MTRYLDEFETRPEYMPYARFLIKMKISRTAKDIYTLFLDRYGLSKMNNWRDEEGHIYIVYPIETLAETMGISDTAVKRAMNELDESGLLIRVRHGFSTLNRLYLLIQEGTKMVGMKEEERPENPTYADVNSGKNAAIPGQKCTQSATKVPVSQEQNAPDEGTESSHQSVRKVPVTEEENVPSDSTKSSSQSGTNVPSNNININHINNNNINNKQSILNQLKENNSISNHMSVNNRGGKNQPDGEKKEEGTEKKEEGIVKREEVQEKKMYGKYGNVRLTEEEYRTIRAIAPLSFPAALAMASEFLHRNPAEAQKPEYADHAALLRRLMR